MVVIRVHRTVAGLACAALLAAGLATLGAAPAAAVDQTVTSVTVVGETAAFVGHGEARVFSPANGGTVRLSGGPRDLSLDVAEQDIGDEPGHYTLRLAAPLGEELATGTYEPTAQHPQEATAALDVGGDGRGCNTSSGRLVVLDIAHSGDTVERLHALFEQRCEDTEAAVFGEIRYRMPGGDPALLVAPGRVAWPLTHADTPARPVPVTLANTGDAPVRIGAPEISGEDASSFVVHHDGCRAELAVGDVCEIHVRFVPIAAGSHAAVLTVSTSTSAQTHDVALSGVAASGTTAWQLRSDPGDPVGAGQSHDWTPATAVITAGGNGRYVAVSVDSPSGHYTAVFAGDGEVMRPGTYERAGPYGGEGSGPQLTVARSDRRCDGSTGRFTVHEIAVSGERLERFSATFEQRCDGAQSALSGTVSYRAQQPGTFTSSAIGSTPAEAQGGPVKETTAVRLRSESGDPFLRGESRDWTPANAAIAAGGSEASFRVDVELDQDRFTAEFLPGRNDVLLPGRTYTRARRAGYHFPFPGLTISGGGVGCNSIFGSFTVHELSYDEQGVRFSASFEQHCEGADARMVGTVAHRALRPPPMPATAPRFSDVAGNVHERNIGLVADQQIAAGYPDGTYRPGLPVTRGQLAAFLTRALDLPPGPPSTYSDTGGSVHADAIESVTGAGIASGYSDGTYRPDDAVSRAQMAAFLTRALDLPPGPPDSFNDTSGDVHEQAIDAVAARGIAAGYGDGSYGLGAPVTRAHMATFLVRALDLDH